MRIDKIIWQAATLITEWDYYGLRFKALSVPREVIDEDCDEPSALLVIGVDSGNVNIYCQFFDPAFDRMREQDNREFLDLLNHAPASVIEFAESIGLKGGSMTNIANNEEVSRIAEQLYELTMFCYNVDYMAWCKLLCYDPDNDYSREKWSRFQQKPMDFIWEQTEKRKMIARYLYEKSESKCGVSNHEMMLGNALHKVLIKAGVLNEDSTPTGPELILAAEDYAGLK